MRSRRFVFTARTDVGAVRRDNQDSGYASGHLLMIADGVGGAARGDVASSVVVDTVARLDTAAAAPDAISSDEDPLARIAHAIHLAHDRLAEIVEQHPDLDGTSTTLTAGWFDGDTLHIGHIGDSRAYLLRDGRLTALTSDHTLVQSLVDEGQISEEEARSHPHRNLILRAVDGIHDPDPDLTTVALEAGDRLMFCSDGCSGSLDNDELRTILTSGDLDHVAHELVVGALEGGSTDNITVVVADVVETDAGAPAPAPGNAEHTATDAAQRVGAIALAPHLDLGDPITGNLSDEDLETLAGEESADPEEIRYAPRPPRRYAWLRAVLAIAIIVLLIAAGLTLFRNWTQRQFFVGTHDGVVVVYQGIPVEIPWVSPRTVASSTTIRVDDLQDVDAQSARNGIPVADVAEGLRKARELRIAFDEPEILPPSPSPTVDPDDGDKKRSKKNRASTNQTSPTTPEKQRGADGRAP